MDQKFQSSFIPKKPVTASGRGLKKSSSISILGIVGTVIFAATLALAVGLFLYQQYVESSIERMDKTLVAAQEAFEPELIKNLLRLDGRINSAKELLVNHIAVSSFFEMLETYTLREVRFLDFSYSALTQGGIGVTMNGEATSYATVALQSDVFDKLPQLQEPIFSDIDLNEEGNVVFTFKTIVDPSFLLYKNQITDITKGDNQLGPSAITTNQR